MGLVPIEGDTIEGDVIVRHLLLGILLQTIQERAARLHGYMSSNANDGANPTAGVVIGGGGVRGAIGPHLTNFNHRPRRSI